MQFSLAGVRRPRVGLAGVTQQAVPTETLQTTDQQLNAGPAAAAQQLTVLGNCVDFWKRAVPAPEAESLPPFQESSVLGPWNGGIGDSYFLDNLHLLLPP